MNLKRNDSGREIIPAQIMEHDVRQFAELAAELHRRLDDYVLTKHIPALILNNMITAERHARKAVSHLRAATLIAEADI